MNILVIEAVEFESSKSIELQTEKKSALIYFAGSYLQVVCQNAAHRVWGGAGRVFHGGDAWEQAVAAYKSPEMKAMIRFAKFEMCEAQPTLFKKAEDEI